jgi:prepilin-type N-terminal cleavage/methylation domain-containing protein
MINKSNITTKDQLGFTVIEIMVGIALFAVIVPSIIFAVVSINQVNDRAADLTLANVLAENKVESLRSAGYNSLVDGTYDFSSELTPTFTLPRQANYIITSPETGIKQIEINIQYTDRGVSRQLQYKSLIGELGVSQ